MKNNFVGREENPPVSVIILSYNHREYIRECLDSVLEQEFSFAAEIIVGDDCSDDGTQEILKEYKEKYPFIQLVLRDKNIGATNNAFDLSSRMRGAYYAYLEGDDYWCDKDKLRIQYEYLASRPELAGCYHDCRIVDINGGTINKKLYWLSRKKRFTLNDFDGVKIPGHSSTWMRKNLYLDKSIDFSPVYSLNRNIGDRTCVLIFLANGSFEKLNRTMSCYRYVRKGEKKSLTARNYSGLRAFADEYEMAEFFESFISEKYKTPLVLEKRKNRIICDVFFQVLKTGSPEAKQLFKVMLNKSRSRAAALLALFPNFLGKIMRRLFYLQ